MSDMHSPRNGFPQGGSALPMYNNSPGMYSPTQELYSSRNLPSAMFSSSNPSQGMYSPPNASQTMHSPNNASQGMYSPRNSSQVMYSPRNTSQGMYSPRNLSTLHPKAVSKSFYRSRNSSGYNSSRQSFSSNDGFSPRGKPYDRRNHKQGGNSEKRYNIQDYINPSMLEDPWAALEAERKYKSIGLHL